MDWEKEMLSQISVYDIDQGFKDSEVYQKLIRIGDKMYPATQYGNVYKVEDDPFSSAMLQIVSTSYYLGVASFIQLERGLYLNKGYNLEYPYAITLRSMIELVGRVHKGIRLYVTYKQSQNREDFINGCRRLVTSFVPGSNGTGGYNVITLVESLQDKIPNIREEYDRISDYLHGNVMLHANFRKISYLFGQMPPKDASMDEVMSALKGSLSPIINMHAQLLESLRKVLLDDLEIALALGMPFANRYKKYIEEKNSSQ